MITLCQVFTIPSDVVMIMQLVNSLHTNTINTILLGLAITVIDLTVFTVYDLTVFTNGIVTIIKVFELKLKSLMAKWLEQASQWHEMYCHDLWVMNLNPIRIDFAVLSTSVLNCTWNKNNICCRHPAWPLRKWQVTDDNFVVPQVLPI